MPLVQNEPDGPKERPPWRGVVVGAAAGIAFILVLSVAAWSTRDTLSGVPSHPDPDAGFPDAGFPDAGFADAGQLEGPIGDVDGGPIVVAGPPVNAGDVAQAVVPVVAECLKAALRFDPGLGGKVTARVVVHKGALTVTLPSSPSPVLASCVGSHPGVVWTAADVVAGDASPVFVEATLTLDGLRATVKLVSADVVAAP